MNTKIKENHSDHPDMHDLSDDMGVEFRDDNVILYDTRAYSPKRVTVITSEEMKKLLTLYLDKRCPVCLGQMKENCDICDNCLESARAEDSGVPHWVARPRRWDGSARVKEE